jgi:hypothetical protein
MSARPETALVRSIVDRTVISNKGVLISMKATALGKALGIIDIGELVIENAATIARKGRVQRLVISGGPDTRKPVPSLVLALVRARRWFKMLVERKVESIADLARLEGVTRGGSAIRLPLRSLLPTSCAPS